MNNYKINLVSNDKRYYLCSTKVNKNLYIMTQILFAQFKPVKGWPNVYALFITWKTGNTDIIAQGDINVVMYYYNQIIW